MLLLGFEDSFSSVLTSSYSSGPALRGVCPGLSRVVWLRRLVFICACVFVLYWTCHEPWVGEFGKVFCVLLAAIRATLANWLLAWRLTMPDPWVWQERIDPSNVILESKSVPVSPTASHAEVPRLNSLPLALITGMEVCHAPPAVTCCKAPTTARHLLLLMRTQLWLFGHWQAAGRNIHVSKDALEVLPSHPELSRALLAKIWAKVPSELRMITPGQ